VIDSSAQIIDSVVVVAAVEDIHLELVVDSSVVVGVEQVEVVVVVAADIAGKVDVVEEEVDVERVDFDIVVEEVVDAVAVVE
jgi:hypothetical protein